MATKTFRHYDVAVSGFGKLDEGSAPTAADTLSKASWTVNANTGTGSALDMFAYGSTVTMLDGDIISSRPPPSSGNGLRSLNTLSGNFDAGTWTFVFNVISSLTSLNVKAGMGFKLYKGSAADGSNAVQIMSAVSSADATVSITAKDITATASLSLVSFNDEYLFMTLNWAVTSTDFINHTGITTLRVGTTRIDTPNFSVVYNATLLESATATDLVSAQQVFNNLLSEAAIISWGVAGNWGNQTAVWGGASIEQFVSVMIFNPPLTESGNATDTLVGNAIFPNTLSEPTTPTDSYVPNLVITKTLSETGSASDSLTCVMTLVPSLIESLQSFWGTPGRLWGDTTGTWAGTTATDSISSSQIFVNTLVESANSSEIYSSSQVFVNSLTETATAIDSLVPNLVISLALNESGSASDIYVPSLVMSSALIEVASALWGSPGILWGASTGVWGDTSLDSLSSNQIFACFLTEIVTAVDSPQASQIFVSSLIESVFPIDIYIPNLVISQILLEVSGAVDSFTTQQVFSNFLGEAVTAQDSLSFNVVGSASNIILVQLPLVIFGTVDLKDPLGVDIFSFPDIDPVGTLVAGIKGLGQRLARRLTNPRGAWFWAPNECTDIRQYLNDVVTNSLLNIIQKDVEREVLREEVVKTSNASVVYDSKKNTLNISITGVTKEGPFDFVFEISSSKITILNS